jgi:hypothetical protein
MNRAIEMMGRAKEYSGKRVIDDPSRDVEKGEIFLSQLPWALKMVFYLLPLTHCSMCLRAAALGDSFPWWSLLAMSAFLLAFSLGSMAVLRRLCRDADKKRFDPALILPTNADRIGQRVTTKLIAPAFYPLMNLSQPA